MSIFNNQMVDTLRGQGTSDVGSARNDYATTTRSEFNNYMTNYAPIEDEMLDLAQNDTSLIDAAPEDAANATRIAKGITNRNVERYGGELTPAQRRELGREQQRTGQKTLVTAQNLAQRDQQEINLQRLSAVMNSGISSKNSGLALMQSSAQSEAARNSAYNQNRAQSRSTNIGLAGTAAAFIGMMI